MERPNATGRATADLHRPAVPAARARLVRFVAPYRVELADVALPDPGDGDVVVRTEYSGISAGTEMLAYRGELDPRLPLDETLGAFVGTFEYPFAFGYSAVGIVERSRSAVPEGARVFAFHPHQDVFVVATEDVVPLGDLDPRSATLFPLVETALQLCLDADVRYGEHAAVVGLGALGILTASLLARSGATVVASDPREWRRDAAAAVGVAAVSPADLQATARERTAGRGLDLVVEASGNPQALGESLGLLATEGVALVASWYGTKPVTLPLGGDFHRRRLEIRSSQVSLVGSRAGRWDRARRRDAARALLRELPVEELVTHEFPFEQAADAYAAIERGEHGLVHAVLRYA